MWTEHVPQLTGQLVAVREIVASDAPTLFELLSDPAVTEHLSRPPPSVDAFAGFVRWAHGQRAAGQGVCFGIVPHGLTAAVGIVQVRALEPTFFTAEWGFALGVSFWSTGIFVEAATLVADFTFTTLKAHRIEARAVSDNARGHAAIQKLGARAEGTLAKAFRKDGRLDRQLLWSVTKDEWQERDRSAPRLTSAEATTHIARAIEETKRTVAASPRIETPRHAEPYPFFLTDSKSWGPAVREGRRASNRVDAGDRARPHVLIIDDNPTQLDLYAMVLEEAAEVQKATRGEMGYQLACREQPDVIIVDVLLPDVDGLTISKRLRANPVTAAIPIIVLTGDEEAYARAQREPLAFSAILAKPCSANLLLSVIESATTT